MKTINYFLKNSLYLIFISVIVFLIIVLSDLKCNTSEAKIIKTTIKKHISKKNLIPSDTIFPNPEIITQVKYITDTLFLTDTVYKISDIVIDFFTTYNYKDTLKIDTVGYVFLNDSVTQNRIYYRGIDYNINSYTKIVPEKYLFRGSYGGFYMNYDTINVLGANLSIRAKKITIMGGYGKDINRLFDENNNIILFSLQKNFEFKRIRNKY